MIEGKSFEQILSDMLSRVPNDVDKREGSIIYDALAPIAVELAQTYTYLDYLDLMTYADHATDDFLTLRCEERGIMRRGATHAVRKGTFNVAVPMGARFSLNDTTYVVESAIDELNYSVRCEQLGSIGNLYDGKMTPIANIDRLSSAILSDILIPGVEIETDEALRKRYFDSLESEAYGGNVADYEAKTKSLPGVGGVRVLPAWNGGGTVKLTIIDSEFNSPSSTLVEKVQNIIDPVGHSGEGIGIAPIGHVVTVEAVASTTITISTNVTLQSDQSWEDVKPRLVIAFEEYLKDLRSKWDDEQLVVRISYLETRALSVAGVIDVSATTINREAKNLILVNDSIPVLGEVVRRV